MEAKSILQTRKESAYTSHQGSRKSITNSVKTPALLFYKPNQNTGKKNKGQIDHVEDRGQSKYQNAASRLDLMQIACQNHPQVIAKYYSTTEQQQQVFYCDRCAELLQDQGFKVAVIPITCHLKKQGNGCSVRNRKSKSTTEFPFPERQFQINKFLSNLNECQGVLGGNIENIREILIESEQFYGQQIEEINDYFQNIIQSLELQKNKCYNHILMERQNAQKETRNLMHKLNEGQKQINSMMADIQDNLDSVFSISWQNYKLVMDTFDGRLSEIFNLIEDLKVNGISDVQYRKIQFAGVPQSINSLSEIIIQNSYGSANYTDGSLLLTQGSSGSFQKNRSIQQINENQVYQKSIFDKFRKDLSEQSGLSQANHMVFSFDGEKMRQLNGEYSQNPLRNQNKRDGNVDGIELRKNRLKEMMYGEVERVEGIKQVEQIDVLVMDDQMEVPAGLRLVR